MSTVTLRWIGDLDQDKREQAGCVSSSSDQYRPKKIELKPGQKEIRIGRINTKMPPDYPIESCINSRMISRNHATIERSAKGGSMLYDHSMNGTYVNYTRVIGGVTLKHGDIVCFGHLNGANLKPGEKVSLFYSDLKYQVELSDAPPSKETPANTGSVKKRKSHMAHSGSTVSSTQRSEEDDDASGDSGDNAKRSKSSADFIETALTLKLKLDCLDDAEPVKSVSSSIQTLFKPIQIGRPIVRVAPVPSSSFYRPWYRLKAISNGNKSNSFTVSTDPWIPVNPKRFQLSVLEDPNQWVRDYLWPVIEDQDPEKSDVSNQPDAPTIPSPTESENCLCMDPVYTPPSIDGQSVREKIKFSITHRGQWLRVILCLDTTVTPSDSFTVSTDPWIPVNPKRFQLSVLEDPNQWVRDYLWPVIEDQDPEKSDVSNQPDAPTIPSPSQPTVLT
ncbi:Lysine specific demethylase 5B [Fasciola gigantica]|uniref:Lysine specific demethylase 5B n=1 Tax=Fasciola gigantica TaxID=46835 RepID=A0A504YPA2_FASGI|nr:Lysine specific demethylase 5B [Fasciola gigantica]